MTAEELHAYGRGTENDRRQLRKAAQERVEQDQERERQLTAALLPLLADISYENRLAGARADLEAFERGDDDLMGFPRSTFDLTAALRRMGTR